MSARARERPWTEPDRPIRVRAAEVPAPRVSGVGVLTGREESPGAATGLIPVPTPAVEGERFRRSTRECLLAAMAVRRAVAEGGLDAIAPAGERTGLLYVSASAYSAANRAFLEDETSATLHFPYTAPSAVPGEVTIEFGIRGPCVTLMGGGAVTLAAVWQAARWLADGVADRVLLLAVETMLEVQDLFARARRLWEPPLVEGSVCLVLEPGPGPLLRWTSAAARGRDLPAAVGGVLDAVLQDTSPRVVASSAGPGGLRRAEARALAGRRVEVGPSRTPWPGEALACGPLFALADARSRGASGPCLVTAAWRGEYAAMLWPL